MCRRSECFSFESIPEYSFVISVFVCLAVVEFVLVVEVDWQ